MRMRSPVLLLVVTTLVLAAAAGARAQALPGGPGALLPGSALLGGCTDSAGVLCLGGRFAVTGSWQTSSAAGMAFVQRLTADTGYLWFFDASNVEAVVKVLDGCAFNDRYWVFAGGLTDVEVELTVTDTSTGAARTYHNPANTKFQPIQDTDAFATCSGSASLAALVDSAAARPSLGRAGETSSTAAGSCTPDLTSLCLNGGRFRVQAHFDAGGGVSGTAHAVKLTTDTGYLWFFGSSNVEVVAKVLDGCGLNEHHWVFAGGLTDVNVVMTVTDTTTGSTQTYTNPPRTKFQPIQDTSAFSSCAPAGDAPPQADLRVSCVDRTCTAATRSSDDVGIARYLWDWGDGTPVDEPTSPYPWSEQTHSYAHSGRFTVTHTVVDTAGQTASAALEVVPNTAPAATDDTATTMRDMPVTIDLLGNDSDADGDVLSFGSVSPQQPGAGYETVPTPSGSALRFTPPDTFVGVMTFTYVAFDAWGGQDSATVTVTVNQFGGAVSAPPSEKKAAMQDDRGGRRRLRLPAPVRGR